MKSPGLEIGLLNFHLCSGPIHQWSRGGWLGIGIHFREVLLLPSPSVRYLELEQRLVSMEGYLECESAS